MIRFRCFLLVSLFLSNISIAYADQQWVEVRSPHFTVATDAGEKRGRDVALRFEQMRMAFGALFKNVNVNTPVSPQIIAFRNGKELRQYAPLYQGKPIELAGFFLGANVHSGRHSDNEQEFIALDLSQEDNWSTVFHEYAHLLINSNFPPTPVWFDEGFAEYCSSLKVDKKEIDLGLVRPDLPQTLSESRWLRLVDLFSVGHDSQIYNRDDRRGLFYAQSWVTVHYLMSKNLMKQMSAYNNMVREQHVEVPQAIRNAFGMDADQLGKAVEDYFRSRSFTYFKMPAPPGSDTIPFTARPFNDLDIKSLLADFDVHTPDYRQRGVDAFLEIVSKQPENATANRALGYAALQKGEWEKAGEYFKRAATQPTKDPQVHYLLALLMSRKNLQMGTSPDDLEAMKKELNTAISLDPEFPDAYSLLGIALSYGGEKEAAVNALKKAIALSPRNEQYQVNLVNVYLRNKNIEEAVSLLKQLQRSSDPQTAAMARQQLAEVENYKNAVAHPGQVSVQQAEVEGDKESAEPEDTEAPKMEAAPKIPAKVEPILFLKGTLVSVDCSQSPAALVTITSGGKTWKMLAPEAKKLIVIGADSLSCAWVNKKVEVNYRKSGEAEGKLVTLEME